ncbi:MAG: His/Gly/Thr/Pro-type tRNA ligase C-terminal domain-containing protein, partial [Acidimicrobiales bacterium]
RMAWYRRYGIGEQLLRFHDHAKEDLAHYSSQTTDIEFAFPWGWGELEGIANRTDYDLRAHSEHSGVRLEYFDSSTNERYTPYVIEPAAGATRAMMAFLLAAYDEDVVAGERRVVLRLHPEISPFQVAVLPLSKKESLEEISKDVLKRCQEKFMCEYDTTQSIGRRYRRQDEIGTPYCVTVDFESIDDGAVTIRERDTTEQVRLPIENVVAELSDRIAT